MKVPLFDDQDSVRYVRDWDYGLTKKVSCCKEYDSTPVKGIYHNTKCKNWVMVD